MICTTQFNWYKISSERIKLLLKCNCVVFEHNSWIKLNRTNTYNELPKHQICSLKIGSASATSKIQIQKFIRLTRMNQKLGRVQIAPAREAESPLVLGKVSGFRRKIHSMHYHNFGPKLLKCLTNSTESQKGVSRGCFQKINFCCLDFENLSEHARSHWNTWLSPFRNIFGFREAWSRNKFGIRV